MVVLRDIFVPDCSREISSADCSSANSIEKLLRLYMIPFSLRDVARMLSEQMASVSL